MSPTTFTHYSRVILTATLLWSIGGQATPLTIPDFPLFLTSAGVPPNLTLTLDDSGSMSRAFTPDLCGNPNDICNDGNYDSDLDGRFVKSSAYNPIYYNPKTIYIPPVDTNGNALSTSFTNAYINGFNTSSTTVNLSTSYQPSSGLFLHSITDNYHQFMQHYGSDVACRSVSGSNRCQYNSTSGSGVTTWVNMESSAAACSTSTDCKRRPMPAYYYVYDESNTGCTDSTLAARLKNNSCYDIKIVSSTSGVDRDGDGTISSAESDERQNFANWYSFYRTRNLMTISAASLAMATLPEQVRVAWQSLNSCRGSATSLVTSDCEGWETTSPNFSNAIKPFSDTHKSNFYAWLARLKTYSSTPLRTAMVRVGSYYSSTGAGSPYDDDLNGTANTQAVCRKNYHLLMTDGIWNDSDPTSPSLTNMDSTNRTLPDGTAYSSQRPYLDTNSKSLADYAFYYWARDLVSLENKVAPSFVDQSGTAAQRYFNAKNDPATWQHMVNYTVGLGLTPFLTSSGLNWGSNTYDGSYPDILSGSKNWPTTGSSGPAGNAADLWHAAINSRGKFYNVQGPSELNAAFKDIVNTISTAAAAGGGARVSSNFARITETNPTAFLARFNADWSGSLEALPFNADGTLGTTPYWEAGSLIPPGNGNLQSLPRNIITFNDGSAQEFEVSICNSSNSLATVLNKNASGVVDNLCSQRLAWLRGYTAITGASWNSSTSTVTFTAPNHGLKAGNSVVVSGVTVTGATPLALNGNYTVVSVDSNHFTVTMGTDPGGSYVADETDANRDNDDRVRYADFRDRSSVLGDIMYSGVVYAYKDNFGYGGASIAVAGEASYDTYVAGKASRTPVVYVGANDGMLHAFNAEVCTTPGACPNGGKELFAYIPAGVYENLSALTDPLYGKSHKYFVDSTPTLGDVYIDDGTTAGWKTYLVGGLRAGGKSIYALDVSDPNNFTAANVKWEFSYSPNSSDPRHDLGLTFGQPQIAAVSTTQWAAIFGNGYNSASEKAFLYIVDIADGSLIAKISTNNDTSNGLSTPYPFDKNGDGIVDVIYAGDLRGNLWRFQKNSSGDWVLGNGGDPLFVARISSSDPVQAITTQPNAKIIDGKVMVYFGTGRYLEATDLTNDDVQTFYAIWDDSENNPGTVPRSALLEQSIVSSTVAAGSFTTRTVTNNETSDPSNRGCYLNFPATAGQPSERVASSSLIKFFTTSGLNTRVIFTTSTPPSDPCEKSGTSWLMELSTSCGRLGGTSPFDINQDQRFDELDLVDISGQQGQTISGLKLKPETGIVSEITWVEGDSLKGIAYKILPGSTGQVETIANSSDKVTPGSPPKRISWEQIQ